MNGDVAVSAYVALGLGALLGGVVKVRRCLLASAPTTLKGGPELNNLPPTSGA